MEVLTTYLILFFVFLIALIIIISIVIIVKSNDPEENIIRNGERCLGYNLPQKENLVIPYNIVYSCTSSPSRITKTQDTINSIKKQTIKPNYMIFNLPHRFGRTNEEYIIPEFITEDKDIVVNRFEKDYGPATKLVGAILQIPKDEDTWIVVHDDDQLYLQKTTENYVNYINYFNDKKKAFGISLFNFKKNLKGISISNKRFSKNQVFEAFATFCVHRSVFEDDFIPYIEKLNENKDCKFSDDVIISNYLAMKNIDIIIVKEKLCNKDLWWSSGCELEYGNDGDALKNLANNSNNDPCGGHFDKYVKVIKYLKSKDMCYFDL